MLKILLLGALLPGSLLASTYEECLLLTEALSSGSAPDMHVHRIIKESGHSGKFCSRSLDLEDSRITAPGIEAAKGRFYEVSYVYTGSPQHSRETYSIVREVKPSVEELKAMRSPAAPQSRVKEAAENVQRQAGENGYRVELKSAPDIGILCPRGVVCDEKGPYRAYQYRGLNGYVSLFFNAAVVNEMNLAGLKKHFSYIAFNLDFFDGLRFPGWKLAHERMFDSVLREDALGTQVKIHGFSNGVLTGEFEYTHKGPLTWINTRGECLSARPGTAACEVTVKGPVKIRMPFEFRLPACRRVDEKGNCAAQ